MTIAAYRGRCPHCGHDHDQILFHTSDSEELDRLRAEVATTHEANAHLRTENEQVREKANDEAELNAKLMDELASLKERLAQEVADADRLLDIIGIGQKGRTDGGWINVGKCSGHQRETIDALQGESRFGGVMVSRYADVCQQLAAANSRVERMRGEWKTVDITTPGFDGYINLFWGEQILALVRPDIAERIKAALSDIPEAAQEPK